MHSKRKQGTFCLSVLWGAGALAVLLSSLMLFAQPSQVRAEGAPINITFEFEPAKPAYAPGADVSINVTAVNTMPRGDFAYDSLAYEEKVTNISVHFAWMAPNEFAWKNVSNQSRWLAPDALGIESFSLPVSVPTNAAEQTYSYFFRIEYMSHTPWGNITYLWGPDLTYHDFAVASQETLEAPRGGTDYGPYVLGTALGLAIASIGLGMVVYWRASKHAMGPPPGLGEERGPAATVQGVSSGAATYPVIRAAAGEHFPIEKGFIYLVKEKRPNISFAMFNEATSHEAKGMLVVREHPNRLKQLYKFDAAKILWLTRRVGVDHIDPTELSLLSLDITKFVQGTPKSVVLLEGLEYIITQNDFETVLRFVNHLHDFVLAHDCAIIIAVDSRVLSTRELALLERSARIVEPAEIPEPRSPEPPPQEAAA